MGGRIKSKTDPGDALCFTLREFCDLHRISRKMYYRMQKAGTGPQEMRVGNKVLITREAAARWRAQQGVP